MRKSEILVQLLKKLQESLALAIMQVENATEASIEAPKKSEAQYESIKEEMGYLSTAFSKRAFSIQKTIEELIRFSLPQKKQEITLGSLIRVEINGKEQLIFLIPCAGGTNVKVGEETVLIISKHTPLFSSILGKKPGEVIYFNGQKIVIKGVE